MVGFFFEKVGYIGSLKWKKKSTNGSFRLHIYVQKTLIHILYMYCKLEGAVKLSHEMM